MTNDTTRFTIKIGGMAIIAILVIIATWTISEEWDNEPQQEVIVNTELTDSILVIIDDVLYTDTIYDKIEYNARTKEVTNILIGMRYIEYQKTLLTIKKMINEE